MGFNDVIWGLRSVVDCERIDIDSKLCVIWYIKMLSAGYDVKFYGGEMNVWCIGFIVFRGVFGGKWEVLMFLFVMVLVIMVIDLILCGVVFWRFGVCTVASYLTFFLECMKVGVGVVLMIGVGGIIFVIGVLVGMMIEVFVVYVVFFKLCWVVFIYWVC